MVYANADDAVGMQQGTSSFLVPRDTPGLEVTRCNETFGGRFMNKSAAQGPGGVWLVRYEISGLQFTDYWSYVHGRWVFDLLLSYPMAVRLYLVERSIRRPTRLR